MEEDITHIWPQIEIGTFGNISLYILEKNYNEVIKLINENRRSNC